MVQLGWKAGPEQYPPLELLDYTVAAEQAGFDCVDVSDLSIPGMSRDRRASRGPGSARRR
jgi:coenzyme F420-dependent glucose-6-phosphate dehydrogenase